MTREEAIHIIEKDIQIDVRSCTNEEVHAFITALNMAIAALKEQEERAKAESEGRVIVLPCKVGDTVYWLDYNRDACRDCLEYSSFYGMDSLCDKRYELYPEIGGVDDAERCPKHFIEIIEFMATLTWVFNHRADFGKTVFLSREEAEKALRRLEEA